MWKEKDQIQQLMDKHKIRKIPGRSNIEINMEIHSFVADDQDHPLITEIKQHWKELQKEITKIGYKPNTNWVYKDVEEDVKEESLCSHRFITNHEYTYIVVKNWLLLLDYLKPL
jgi:hypothetical protein